MDECDEQRLLSELRDELQRKGHHNYKYGQYQQVDDNLLLKMLRVNDYCVKRSLQQLNRYLKTKDENGDLFNFVNELSVVFKSNVITTLEDRGPNGELLVMIRAGHLNPSLYTFRMFMQAVCVSIECDSNDHCTQRNGVINIVDCSGFGLKHLLYFGPLQAKLLANLMDGILPMKIKAIHLVNGSRLAEIGLNLLKSFLGEHLRAKLHFHGNRYERLHRHIHRSMLPMEIGGDNRALEGLEYFHKIENYIVNGVV